MFPLRGYVNIWKCTCAVVEHFCASVYALRDEGRLEGLGLGPGAVRVEAFAWGGTDSAGGGCFQEYIK